MLEGRAGLHKKIWCIANGWRGSVDGWKSKSYVLGFLFYRFISENLTECVNASEREATTFDYAHLRNEVAESDRARIVKDKGVLQLLCLIREKQVGDSYASGGSRVSWRSDVGLVIRRSVVVLRAKATEYTGLGHRKRYLPAQVIMRFP